LVERWVIASRLVGERLLRKRNPSQGRERQFEKISKREYCFSRRGEILL